MKFSGAVTLKQLTELLIEESLCGINNENT
jgi:hypothetical protein